MHDRIDLNNVLEMDNQQYSEAQPFDRFARFYDDDYRNYQDDLDTIFALAEENDGPVLELGCGTGRVLLSIATLEYPVWGIDISPTLLALAHSKIRAAGLASSVTLQACDMCNFELPEKEFAFAFCTSNTFMHLATPEEQLAALHAVYGHLRDGGQLLIDLFNPDVSRLLDVNGLCELADQWLDPTTSAEVFKWCVRTVDIPAQLQDTLFIYEEVLSDGQVRRTACQFTLRFLWQNEAQLMLQAAGFNLDTVWGDFDGTPYHSNSERLILVASK